MIPYTYTPIKYNEDYVRKLKLERLMFKAMAKDWEYCMRGRLDNGAWYRARARRWSALSHACKKELEK